MPANFFEKSRNNAGNLIHIKLAKESFALYFSHTLRTFAQSLTGIFLPLYIFGLTNKPTIYINEFTNNLAWVIIFYIFRSISLLIFITPVTNIIFGKLNFKRSIALSNLAVSLSLIFVLFADKFFLLIPLTAIAASFDIMLYWIPFHLFFIRKSSDHGRYGKQFGIRLFLTKMASALGPLLGGLIIISLGFPFLFILSVILMLSSVIPLVFSIEEHNHGKHNAFQIFKRYISKKSLYGISTAFSVIAMEDVIYSIIWPLLLFNLTSSFAKLGVITTISVSVSALLAIYIGKMIDKHGTKTIHKVGIIVNSILHFLKYFAGQTGFAFGIDIADKVNGSLYGVPFNAKTYDIAKENHYDSDFMIYREIVMHLGLACGLFILLLLLPAITDYKVLFIVLAAASPLTYLINFRKKN